MAFSPLQVWDLSDIDKDGHLDRDEFAVVSFMHFIVDFIFFSRSSKGHSLLGS